MDFTLNLGCSMSGAPLLWCNAPNNHIYLSGQSGNGKSFAIREYITQAAKQGCRVVVFDCSGDYNNSSKCDALSDAGCSVSVKNVRDMLRIQPFRAMKLTEDYTEGSTDIADRVSEMLADAYQMKGQKQRVALRSALRSYLVCIDDVQKAGIANFCAYVERDDRMYKELEPLMLRLGDMSRIYCDALENIDWELNNSGISILQFNTLPYPDIQVLITELLLSDLWITKLEAGQSCPVIAVIDECQRFRFRESSMLVRILREGRKYQFSGFFSSQWINDKQAVQALEQAALRGFFFPGSTNVRTLAVHLGCDNKEKNELAKLIQRMNIGDYLYRDPSGRIILNHVNSQPGA